MKVRDEFKDIRAYWDKYREDYYNNEVKFQIFFCVNNKIRKKPYFTSTDYKIIFDKFSSLITENRENIIFPQKYTSNKIEVKSKREYIMLTKILPDGSKVLKIEEWYVEETFFLYSKKARYNVAELLKYLFPLYKNYFVKISTYKNKILFDDGEHLECILTKNLDEAQRLYLFIKSNIEKRKVKNFLFFGEIPHRMKSEIIVRLVKATGLKPFQFSRNSTRH